MSVMKKIKYLIHPCKLYEKLRWMNIRKKLKYCGRGTIVKWNFTIASPEYIHIGSNVHIGHDCELRTFPFYNGCSTGYIPELVIKDNVVIADNCYLSCINAIVIGEGTLLGANTFITDNFHGDNTFEQLLTPPDQRKLFSKGSVVIGKNVWTGRNVCIMPGVTIGDGAIIGANAVVTHNIPANSIAVGIPARVIRYIESSDK